jgi:hypothetical protein
MLQLTPAIFSCCSLHLTIRGLLEGARLSVPD